MGRAYNLMYKAIGGLLAPFVLSYCAFLDIGTFSRVFTYIMLHILNDPSKGPGASSTTAYQRLMHRGRARGAEQDFVRSVFCMAPAERRRVPRVSWSLVKICFPRENVGWLFGRGD